MSTLPTLAVWRIRLECPPAVLRRCPRCDTTRAFASSGRFRVNANGRRLDVWLIYRCIDCSTTWNREVLARVSPQSIDPDTYAGYLANDAKLADEVAFTPCDLPWADAPDFVIETPMIAQTVRLVVPNRLSIRLDRVLAAGLGWSRSQVRAAVRAGTIQLPRGTRDLSRPVKDGGLVGFSSV